MATYSLVPFFEQQFFDDNGDPLAGGKVTTYLSGTSTPVFTFSDSTGTLNTNPVILSASGRARIYLDPLLAYKFVLTTSANVAVGLDMDPVSVNLGNSLATSFQASTRGLVGAPVFTFSADTDTGMYSTAANTLAFTTNGTNRVYIGNGMSVGTATDPGAGSLQLNQALIAGAGVTGAQLNATGLIVAASSSNALSSITVNSATAGVNQVGQQVIVGANISGNGAAGSLVVRTKLNVSNYLWSDNSSTPGQLRISTAPPNENATPSDTSGTVVGTQASSLDTKNVLGDGIAPLDALAIILHTPITRFTYKGGSYSGTVFHGIIAEESPEFAMDPDAAHPDGRSFNPVSAFGYTVQAFKAMQAQIDTLTAELKLLSQP